MLFTESRSELEEEGVEEEGKVVGKEGVEEEVVGEEGVEQEEEERKRRSGRWLEGRRSGRGGGVGRGGGRGGRGRGGREKSGDETLMPSVCFQIMETYGVTLSLDFTPEEYISSAFPTLLPDFVAPRHYRVNYLKHLLT